MKKNHLFLRMAAVLAAGLLFLSAMTACSVGHIKDENGDKDTALSTLTKEDLCAEHPHVLEQNAFKSSVDNKISYRVKKMSGVKILHTFHLWSSDPVTLTVSSAVKRGNVRLYVVCNGMILRDIPVGQDEQVIKVSGMTGNCQVRVAAESAEFSVEIMY